MPSETKEWDDEEETIINFTPKPRPSQSRVPEQPSAPPSNDLLGLGAPPSAAYKEIPDDERSSRGVQYADSESSVLQEALQPMSEARVPPPLPIESSVKPPEPSVQPPGYSPFVPSVTPPLPPIGPEASEPPAVSKPEPAAWTPAPGPSALPSLPPLPPPLPPLPINLTPKRVASEQPASLIELPPPSMRPAPLWQNPTEQAPMQDQTPLPAAPSVKPPAEPSVQPPGYSPFVPAVAPEPPVPHFESPFVPTPPVETPSEPVPQPPVQQPAPPKIMLKRDPTLPTPAPPDSLPGFGAPDSLPGFGAMPVKTPSPVVSPPPPIPDLPQPVREAPKREPQPSLDDLDPPTVIDVPSAFQRERDRARSEAAPAAPTPVAEPEPPPVPKPFTPPVIEPVSRAPLPGPGVPADRAPRQPERAPEPPLVPKKEVPVERKEESEEDPERTNIYIPQRTTDEVEEVAWVVLMKTPSVRLHQLFRLDSARMEIGRSYDTPIFLDDRTVSMRHAAIRYERVGDKNEFVLHDLASTNGTYLNDAPVHMAVLKDDDRIRVGETEMAFKKVGEANTRE